MTYTTKQGDMWDSIAKQLYGSEKYTKELMEANTEHLSTLIFPAGIILTVPEVSSTKTKESILPPWRS